MPSEFCIHQIVPGFVVYYLNFGKHEKQIFGISYFVTALISKTTKEISTKLFLFQVEMYRIDVGYPSFCLLGHSIHTV